jgi:hypothetical protein
VANFPRLFTRHSVNADPTPPDTCPTPPTMSSDLEYLKELHTRLSDKIKALEAEAVKKVAPKTPAQQLRTILVGPPGAGVPARFALSDSY